MLLVRNTIRISDKSQMCREEIRRWATVPNKLTLKASWLGPY